MTFKKVKVKDLVELINGYPFKTEDWGLEGKPIIRIQNLNNSEADYNHTSIEVDPKYVIKKGDILIAWAGSLGIYEWEKENEALLNQHLFKVEFKSDDINKVYFKYLLEQVLNELSKKSRGVGIKHLKKGQIENYEFNLPEKSAQEEIVNKIHRLHNIIKKRETTIKKLEEYLHATFTNVFGDPFFNSHNYTTFRLKDVVKPDKIITYGIVQAGPDVREGIPYIKSGDIKDGIILKDQLSKTSIEIAKKYERSKCSTGDLIMSIRATVGAVAILPPELDGANLTQGTARISPDETKINRDFLFNLLSSKGGQALVKAHQKGSTFKEITLAKLREVEIAVPPMSLQEKFAIFYSKIKKQQERLLRFLGLLDEIRTALIYNVFYGNVKGDDLDDFVNDEVQLELFLNTINTSDYENEEQYDINVKRLFKILERTEARNHEDKEYIKGLVQLLKDGRIVLETNKENKYRLIDEAATN